MRQNKFTGNEFADYICLEPLLIREAIDMLYYTVRGIALECESLFSCALRWLCSAWCVGDGTGGHTLQREV